MIEGSITFVFLARFLAAAEPGAGPPGGQPDRFGGLAGLVFCMPVRRVAGMARRPAGQSGPSPVLSDLALNLTVKLPLHLALVPPRL
jgi:hypothetical protein